MLEDKGEESRPLKDVDGSEGLGGRWLFGNGGVEMELIQDSHSNSNSHKFKKISPTIFRLQSSEA